MERWVCRCAVGQAEGVVAGGAQESHARHTPRHRHDGGREYRHARQGERQNMSVSVESAMSRPAGILPPAPHACLCRAFAPAETVEEAKEKGRVGSVGWYFS